MNNWMSRLPDNKKIVLINIPGTHDSAAYYMNRFSLNFAKTQYFTIRQQMDLGVRKLDIRTTKINKNKEKDEDIICCHGICDCYISSKFGDFRKLTLKSILYDIKNFLEENPSETILLDVCYGRGDDICVKRAFEICNKLVGDIIIDYRPDLIIGDIRGKIVNTNYLNEEFDKKGLKIVRTRSKSLIAGVGISDIHRQYSNLATFKISGTLKIQEMKDMFNKYNMTLEKAEKEEKKGRIKFPIAYSISCTGEEDCCLPNPIREANIVHSFIQKDGILKKGYYYGWLNMDFANLYSNSLLIETNFP